MSEQDMTAILTHLSQTTLAVTLMIGLVLLIRRPFAKAFGAPAAYALWALPALRLVLPPLPAGWTLFGLMPPVDAPAPLAETPNVVFTTPDWTPQAAATPAEPVAAEFTAMSVPVLSSEPGMFGRLFEDTTGLAVFALLGIWALGAVIVLGTGIYRQWVFARIVRREASPASLALLTETLGVCQTLGINRRRARVMTSFISDGPLVAGLFRPVVLLPAWFELDYTAEERKVALLHELSHVRRNDLWALQVATVFLSLQWFNPLAHLAMRAFRSDQEAACDADVLGSGASSPHAYGATLVKAVRGSRPVVREPMLAASLPLTHSLTERLQLMRNPQPTLRRRLLGTTLTAGVGAIALVASACSMTAAATPQAATQEGELEGGPLAAPATPDAPEAPKARRHRHVQVFSGDDNREIVLLDNPMDMVTIDIKAMQDLSAVIEIDADEMRAFADRHAAAIADGVAVFAGNLDGQLTISGENGERTIILNGERMNFDGAIADFTNRLNVALADKTVDNDEIEAMAEEFEEKIEAWAEEFEARMEAEAPRLEARMAALAETFDEDFDIRMEELGARIEEKAAIIEEHGERIEHAGELIEDLADKCDDRTGVAVVERLDPESGRSFKAVCLESDGVLTQDDIIEQVRASGELTAEEMARFEQKLDNQRRWSFRFESSNDHNTDHDHDHDREHQED